MTLKALQSQADESIAPISPNVVRTDTAPATSPPDGAADRARRRQERVSWTDRLTWTPRQRRGMVILLALILSLLAWRLVVNRAYVSDPQPAQPARYDDLADRLDPNTATWQELAAIPSLGERRARAIVEHRDDWLRRHPDSVPYQRPFDLAAVSGIGASMIEQMTPHLVFPPRPTTKQTN